MIITLNSNEFELPPTTVNKIGINSSTTCSNNNETSGNLNRCDNSSQKFPVINMSTTNLSSKLEQLSEFKKTFARGIQTVSSYIVITSDLLLLLTYGYIMYYMRSIQRHHGESTKKSIFQNTKKFLWSVY